MLLPEILYTPTSRDAGVRLGQAFQHQMLTVQNNAVISTFLEPPGPRILVLNQINAQVGPDVVPSAQELRLRVTRLPVGTPPTKHLAIFRWAAAAGVEQLAEWKGELWLFPGWCINPFATFSAAAVGNFTQVNFWGFSLPVGTVLPPV